MGSWRKPAHSSEPPVAIRRNIEAAEKRNQRREPHLHFITGQIAKSQGSSVRRSRLRSPGRDRRSDCWPNKEAAAVTACTSPGRSGPSSATGCSHLQRMDRYHRWDGERGHSCSSFRLLTEEGLYRGCVRKTGTVVVRDRSQAASDSTQSG